MTPLADDIRECADGAEAISAYEMSKPDLVLMDIRMSLVDGIEATKRIRILDPAAKIVIVTNCDDRGFHRRPEGACGYALKDALFDLPQFIETLT